MYELEATIDMPLLTGTAKPSIIREHNEAASEASLVTAIIEGSNEQFARLYSRHAPLVHGILLARVPRGEVDDLLQDIFLHAFKKLHTLRDRNAFAPWIATIARNRAMDFHRSSREMVEVTEDLDSTNPPDHAADELLDIIRSLPDTYRETMILRLVEGMTGPEIAARTGLTPASVRVNLHRGMKLLRERLRQRGSKGSL